MTHRSKAKDFYKLQRNIDRFSNGEARITSFDDELTKFEVELNIKDGYYKDGLFSFEVRLCGEYPRNPPSVNFMSPIFHPNIGDGYDSSVVCLNLLSEDWGGNDLEDVVHAMLFLVKNPVVEDALNPLFGEFGLTDCESEDYIDEYLSRTFPELVRRSLEGGEIDGIEFKRNPGLILKGMGLSLSNAKNTFANGEERPRMVGTTDVPSDPISNTVTRQSYTVLESTIGLNKKDLYRHALWWGIKNFLEFLTSYGMKLQTSTPGTTDAILEWLDSFSKLMSYESKQRDNCFTMIRKHLHSCHHLPLIRKKFKRKSLT